MSIRGVLLRKIQDRTARVGVMGMGYVGLPLSLEFVRAGYFVQGFDVDESHVRNLTGGRSSIVDVTDLELASSLRTGRFAVSSDPGSLNPMDVVLICVPTPLSKTRQPDLSFIAAAASTLLARISSGKLIVLESTTYPGTTDEYLANLFSGAGLQEGRDYLLAFSSERVDPGNRDHALRTIPKVVGGTSVVSGEVAGALYDSVFDQMHLVSSARVAELSKLLENTFRNVNIALVNEFKQICDTLGVSVWEVIEAASTKPFGFMPFYPGPGIGGHCIPLDPQYLVYKARLSGFEPRLVTLADQINMSMPRYTALEVMELLNRQGKAMRGAAVLVLGVTYKPDIPDMRESPAVAVIEELLSRGADVSFVDPYIDSIDAAGVKILGDRSLTPDRLAGSDVILIMTAHGVLDLKPVFEVRAKVVDTRNALGRYEDLLESRVVAD